MTTSAEGRGSGDGRAVGRERPAARIAALTEGGRYALVIGIDAYQHGIAPLAGATADARAVARERITRLASPRGDGVHETDIPSAPATRERLTRALTALGGEHITPTDSVLIYYSGHGASVPVIRGSVRATHEALVPVDAGEDARGVFESLFFDVEFNRLLRRIVRRTDRVTVILDCCHSGGATRDALDGDGDARRSIHVRAAAPPALSDEDDAQDRSRGDGDLRTSVADCQIVAACLSDELARECDDENGRRHGLLTQTLLGLLREVDPAALRAMTWGRIWRQLVAGVERRRPQHPTLRGSFARPLFGGPPRAGDTGIGLTHEGERFRVDAGELAGVTLGARLAVYGSSPATFPPLGSGADHEARVGHARVTYATRSTAIAELDGAPFELPVGARARVVEAGARAKLVVGLDAREGELRKLIGASGLLRVADDGERPAVGVVRRANGDLVVVDDHHGVGDAPGEPWLVRIPADSERSLGAVLEQYARYAAPLRMAELCTSLPGALRLELLDCNGVALTGDGRLRSGDTQLHDLPQVPRAADGVYELRHEQLLCFRVLNTSDSRLRVALFDCAPEGCVALLGEEMLAPGESHTFWWNDEPGTPFPVSVQLGRRVSLDRPVVIGTNAVERSLRHLVTPPGESFEASMTFRAVGVAGNGAMPEQWTAARATLRTRERG